MFLINHLISPSKNQEKYLEPPKVDDLNFPPLSSSQSATNIGNIEESKKDPAPSSTTSSFPGSSSANLSNAKTKQQKEEIKKLKDDLSNFRLRVSSLERERNDLNAQVINLNKINTNLRGEKNSVTSFNDSLRKENETLRNNNRMLENNNDSLRKSVSRLEMDAKQKNTDFQYQVEDLQVEITKIKDENEKSRVAIVQQSSLLDEKDRVIKQYSEQIRIEKDRSAEIVSNFGTVNKHKEVQLNNNLPRSIDLNLEMEKLLNQMEEYYTNTELMALSDDELTPFLEEIFRVCLERCTSCFEFPNKMLFRGKPPNEQQLYHYKCMIYGMENHHLESLELSLADLGSLFSKTIRDYDLKRTQDFVSSCCKFIWTVLLAQPNCKFNPAHVNTDGKEIKYSADLHKSFGKLEKGVPMVVSNVIIPSVIRTENNQMETKCYVYLKSKILNTNHTRPTTVSETSNGPSPSSNVQMKDGERHSYETSFSTAKYATPVTVTSNVSDAYLSCLEKNETKSELSRSTEKKQSASSHSSYSDTQLYGNLTTRHTSTHDERQPAEPSYTSTSYNDKATTYVSFVDKHPVEPSYSTNPYGEKTSYASSSGIQPVGSHYTNPYGDSVGKPAEPSYTSSYGRHPVEPNYINNPYGDKTTTSISSANPTKETNKTTYNSLERNTNDYSYEKRDVEMEDNSYSGY